MGFISWIIFGALAGWIASRITGRAERMGCLTNMVGHRHIAGVLGRSGDKDREAENHRSGVEIFHTEKDCLLAVLINV